ncbi:MAG: hypothetical protein LBI17_03110 [Rickettsiales bacterium]|jgi:hypothetical protein|nr:hypothetical protein [Rickettsiales bacterium]
MSEANVPAQKTPNDGISINIKPSYESSKPDMMPAEKSARDFLKILHKAMIAVGRVCYIGAIGVSLFAFIAGGALPPETHEICSSIDKLGWQAWQINIAARTVMFYFLGNPLTKAATWIATHLPKRVGKPAKLTKQEELLAAIEWKAGEFSTDYIKEAEQMTDLDIQRHHIKDNIKTNPKYAKILIHEYRQRYN